MKKKILGQRIAYLRGIKEMTQKSLAKKIGVDEVTISRLENDHFKPSFETLSAMADIFEVTIDQLIKGE